jgi:hypothetical protein
MMGPSRTTGTVAAARTVLALSRAAINFAGCESIALRLADAPWAWQ